MSAPGSGEVPPARRRRGPVDRRLVVRLGSARLGVAAGVGLGLVATAAVVVQAVLLAHLLAAMAPRHVPSHLVAALAGLAATALVRALAAALGELAGRDGAERVKRSLRRELLLASLGRPLAGGRAACPPAATGPGSLAVLAGPGLDALDAYVARCLPDLVLGVVAPVALLVAVGLIDWPSALVVAVALGLFPLFGVLVGRSTSTLARRRLGQVAELSDRLVDLFVGLPVLRCLGRAGEQRASLAAAGESLRRSSMAALRVAFLSALVLDTLASISTALVAVPLGLRLIWGSAHLAPALAVLVVAPEVYLPLRRASAEFHESAAGLAAAGKVLDALGDPAGRPAALPAGVGGAPLRAAGRRERSLGRVELRGVTLEWAASPHPVLAGVDLEVAPGERIAVIGASGSGKSTLLQVLLGLVEPSAGAMLAGGCAVGQDLEGWLAGIAYLPERPALLPASLGDNLRLAAPAATDADCRAALAALGAAGRSSRLDCDLATLVGDGGRPLSAGQRQRVGLGRVLLRRASLYLLDEPTAHLDDGTEEAAVAALDAAIASSAAVVVTHRPAVLALADRVLRLVERAPGAGAQLEEVTGAELTAAARRAGASPDPAGPPGRPAAMAAAR